MEDTELLVATVPQRRFSPLQYAVGAVVLIVGIVVLTTTREAHFVVHDMNDAPINNVLLSPVDDDDRSILPVECRFSDALMNGEWEASSSEYVAEGGYHWNPINCPDWEPHFNETALCERLPQGSENGSQMLFLTQTWPKFLRFSSWMH